MDGQLRDRLDGSKKPRTFNHEHLEEGVQFFQKIKVLDNQFLHDSSIFCIVHPAEFSYLALLLRSFCFSCFFRFWSLVVSGIVLTILREKIMKSNLRIFFFLLNSEVPSVDWYTSNFTALAHCYLLENFYRNTLQYIRNS